MTASVESRIIYKMKRAEQALRAAIDGRLAEIGISAAQYGALAALRGAPGVTSAALARVCLISAQSMHELIAALIDEGLVERRPRDGRSVELRLSRAGHRALSSADPLVDKVERGLFGNVTQRQDFSAELDRLLAQLRA